MADTKTTEPIETPPEELEAIVEEEELKTPADRCAPGAAWNPVEEAFLKRRSVRKYKKKQVPEHLIRRMLEVGRFAPSQGNCQPWKFVVVRDQDFIEEMERYCVAASVQMYAMIKDDPSMVHPIPVEFLSLIVEGRFSVFHHAPTAIFILMDTRGIGHPEIDIGICGTHISVAAHSLGLGACWVGFAELLNTEEWRERLGVDEPYQLIEAIVVGYPVGKPTQGHVARETHAINWIENGTSRIVY